MRFLLSLLLLVAQPSESTAEGGNEITPANVIALMNARRAEGGLRPLREDSRLTRAAEDRVRHMEELGYWNHQAPDGLSPFVWVMARDYAYKTAGENLARGFETARILVESWMESPGHRDNIMTPDFAECGVAIIEGSTTGPATGKSIVVLFAAPRDGAVAVRQP